MSRVYDAIKRAGPADSNVRCDQTYKAVHREKPRTNRIVPSGTEIQEQLFPASSFPKRAESTVKS